MSKKIANDDNSSGDSYNGGAAVAKSLLSSSNEDMQKIARTAARVRAMEGDFEILPHGSKIYFVAKGWESSIIESDPRVKCAITLRDFRKSFCDSEVKTIFIPQNGSGGVQEENLITLSQIRKVCRQYAVSKVIYMEGDW